MGRRRKSDLTNIVFGNETESNSSSSSHLTLVQRNAANDRERTRMRVLSKAFLKLKTSLPWVPKDTKLSKLDTLKLATIYISYLTCILKEDDSHLIDISEYSSCTSSKFDIKQIIPVFITNFKASSIEKHRSLISNLTDSHKSQTHSQNHNNFSWPLISNALSSSKYCNSSSTSSSTYRETHNEFNNQSFSSAY